MTLTTAAAVYYAIAIPFLILMCKMMWVGGRDEQRPSEGDRYPALAAYHKDAVAEDNRDVVEDTECLDPSIIISLTHN